MRMRTGTLVMAALLFVGAIYAQAPSTDAAVAEVNGEEIAASDVLAEMGRLTLEAQQQILQDPNGKMELVNSIIRRKLLVAESKNFSIDTLDFVKKAVARSAEDIYAQVLLNSVQQQSAQITEEEVTNYYQQNDSLFDLSSRYHIAQVVFADAKTAEDAQKKLKKGKLAWDDATKSYPGVGNNTSGDGGWLFASQIVSDARVAIEKLAVGEITDAIRIGDVFYVIKMIESEPPRHLTLEEVKERVAQVLSQLKGQQAIVDYQNRLYMQAKISYDNAALNAINLGGQPAPGGGQPGGGQ